MELTRPEVVVAAVSVGSIVVVWVRSQVMKFLDERAVRKRLTFGPSTDSSRRARGSEATANSWQDTQDNQGKGGLTDPKPRVPFAR